MRTYCTLSAPLVLLFFALFQVGCKSTKQEPIKIDPAFTNYVSAFTSGIVSRQATINVRLIERVPNVKYSEPMKVNPFSFSPSVDGEAYWYDDKTVEFRPEKPLKSGQLYVVSFDLSKIKQIPDSLGKLEFDFQTMQQGMYVNFDGLKPYNSTALEWQKVMGVVRTADYAESGLVENALIAMQDGKELSIKWVHENEKEHQFVVDSVKRAEKEKKILLKWDETTIGGSNKGTKGIAIPALSDFKIVDLDVVQEPDQYVKIFFSDPLQSAQDLTGLVRLSSGTNVKLIAEENRLKVYPVSRQSGDIDVIVEQSIKNSFGYQLDDKYERKVTFMDIKPAVQLIGDGVILPSSDGLTMPFKAVNLNAVTVRIVKIFQDNVAQFLQVNQLDGTREMKRVGRLIYKEEVPLKSDKAIDYGSWNTFSLDLSKMIEAEPGAIYRIQLSFDQSQSTYPCSNVDQEESPEQEEPSFTDEESVYDNPNQYWSYYDDYYGYSRYRRDYNWNERDDPCKKSYYMTRDRSVIRNVLASDLGIIAKGGSGGELLVAVTDIKSTDHLAGIDLELYNFQNQLITKTKTNKEGMATIDLSKKTFLLVAKKGEQRGYLRLDDGSALSLSMFDVGGQQNKEGVKGYIYGERGVWRPGDSLYVTFVLEDENKVLPSNHPVVFELYTPENQLYQRNVRTSSLNNFYDFRTVTDQDASTGNWLTKFKVGGSTFSKTLKIETVKPNRLKIKLDFQTDILRKDSPDGQLEVKWLHGAVAKDMKTDIAVTMTAGKTTFEDFPDYSFDDPSKKFNSEENIIFEGKLNSKGVAIVKPKFAVTENAPGMLNTNFTIRAFEKGGDFSIDRFTMPYSPYKGYAGIKVPKGEGWNDALYGDEPNVVSIVTVDENGNAVDRKKVIVETYNVRWRWWWDRTYGDDLSHYVAKSHDFLISRDTVSTVDGKALYEMNFDEDYYGRRLIRVIDPTTGHSAGQVFYVTYRGWWSRSDGQNPGGAEMLTFKTNKDKYGINEEVTIDLPAMTQGKALVSIESGSKMVDVFWVQVTKDQHKFTFKTTKDMSPNVYVHVALIQPHKNVQNDLPIRLYGVQPIFVENPESHLQPEIDMADELAPEEKVTIKVSETTGKKMTYTVAVVDEGLLDLTRFKTPNPWNAFNAREALGVKTWDMYKYVIGAFSGELAGLLAIGGDEEVKGKPDRKANRFKPVVTFLGPFELDPGSENTHTFTMPNYVGSVRTMVVAGNQSAYGSVEKTTPVKKPLMVLATLPRVVGPGESVKLPVTVFAMDKKVKEVNVEVELSDKFTAKESTKKKIVFSEIGDQVVNFDLDVAKEVGIGKVKVIATSGKEKAVYDIEIDVRPPNPRVNEVINAVVDAGETWESEYTPVGLAGTNNGVVEVSKIPPINLEKRLKYLVRYPHGCVEQTTSSVFPQLFLSKLLEMEDYKKAEIDRNIRAAIDKLRRFQKPNGGLAYWPGWSQDISDWGTTYAGHFMIEAEAQGYQLPIGFKKKWVQYQTEQANRWVLERQHAYRYYYRSDALAQAYRLYTLALANEPAMGAMNRLREINDLPVAAAWRLAAAYYLTGKPEVAEGLVKGVTTHIDAYRELAYSYGSSDRDKAMILETLTLMNRKSLAKEVLDEIAKKLNSRGWYSTQTTAYALMAIAKFVGANGSHSDMKFDLYDGDEKKSVSTGASISQTTLNIIEAEKGKVKITNKSDQTLFVKLQLDGIPLTGDQTNASNDLNMVVRYLDMGGNEIDPESLDQGTDFMAEVQVSHPGVRGYYDNMALTQIFPSGWEIKNTRMDAVESVQEMDIPRYQDIRDDRVYSYFSIGTNQNLTYRVLLNAAYMGRFYLSTVYCEAMYDNEINARRAGKWVKVVEPGSSQANVH